MVLHNMLRRLAYPFQVLRSSRPPISVNARTQFDRYGQAQYQSVRFQAWRSRPRDLLFPIIAASAMYEVWRWTVLRPLDNLGNELDEALKELPEEDRKKLEEEMEETAFFPFPLTTDIIQPGPYSRLDPEIAEYHKIQKDKALQAQIHKDAAPWVAEHLPEHDYRFARMKPKPYQAWTDIRFQELPPPYYTQSGLEIGGEAPFISWETFQIEPEVAHRLERVLYPLPAAKAMWNYLRVAFTLGDANEKAGAIATEHMKLPTGYKVTLQQLVAATPEGRKQLEKQRAENRKKAADMAMRLVEDQNKTIDTKMKTSEDGSVSQQPAETSLIPSFGQNENNGQTSEKSQPTTITDLLRKIKEGSWTPEDNEEMRQYLLTVPAVQTYIQIAKRFEYASAIFKLTFQKENKPMVCPPPRGAVGLSGLFLMTIPNGWVMLDVDMHWDPKTKTFDENSFSAKTLKMRVNKPPITGVQTKALSSPTPEGKK